MQPIPCRRYFVPNGLPSYLESYYPPNKGKCVKNAQSLANFNLSHNGHKVLIAPRRKCTSRPQRERQSQKKGEWRGNDKKDQLVSGKCGYFECSLLLVESIQKCCKFCKVLQLVSGKQFPEHWGKIEVSCGSNHHLVKPWPSRTWPCCIENASKVWSQNAFTLFC